MSKPRKLQALKPGDPILVDTRPLYLSPSVWTPATFVKWLGSGDYCPGAICTMLIEETIRAPSTEPCEHGSKVDTCFVRLTEDN
jgi:hypothetical protein